MSRAPQHSAAGPGSPASVGSSGGAAGLGGAVGFWVWAVFFEFGFGFGVLVFFLGLEATFWGYTSRSFGRVFGGFSWVLFGVGFWRRLFGG